MITDYKIVSERDEGGIVYQKVRFYEGAVSEEDEFDMDTNSMKPITRYRRTGMYEEKEYLYEQTTN